MEQNNEKIVYVVKKDEKSNGVAAILTLFIPGAGHMYKERVGEGLAWLVFVVIGYMFMVVPGFILHMICIFSAISSSEVKNEAPSITDDHLCPASPVEVEKSMAKNRSLMIETFESSITKAHGLYTRDLITSDEFKSAKKAAIDIALDSNAKPEMNDFLVMMIPMIDSGAITKEEIVDIKARYHYFKQVG
jgi:hypothetical protein